MGRFCERLMIGRKKNVTFTRIPFTNFTIALVDAKKCFKTTYVIFLQAWVNKFQKHTNKFNQRNPIQQQMLINVKIMFSSVHKP